jgi:hypothetical protein
MTAIEEVRGPFFLSPLVTNISLTVVERMTFSLSLERVTGTL